MKNNKRNVSNIFLLECIYATFIHLSFYRDTSVWVWKSCENRFRGHCVLINEPRLRGSWYLFLTFPINLLNYERAMNFFFFFRTTPQGRRLFLPKIREEKRSVFYASFTDERSQGWRSRFFAVIALITKRSRKRFRGSIKADRSNILGVVAIGL